MYFQIITIVFAFCVGLLYEIRILHNLKNKEHLINLYPNAIKLKWEKIYKNTTMYILQITLLIIFVLGIVIIVITRRTESDLRNISFGFLFYISFIVVFNEARTLINQIFIVKRIKENKPIESNPQEIVRSMLTILPLYILIGIFPFVFCLETLSSFNIGLIIAGPIFILFYLLKMIKIKANNKKSNGV